MDAVGGVDVLVVVVAVLVLGAVLVGSWLWLRYRYRPAGVVLRSRLAEVSEIAILMHPKPDPDSMASAVAVGRIAAAAGTAVTIQYPGEIRHPENRAFLTVLDLDIQQIDAAEEIAADAVVLVDHNEPRGFEGAERVTPYAVIDHHPGGGEGTVFTDVRTDYGACATIVTEYLEALDAERTRVPGPGGLRIESAASGRGRLQLPNELATGLAYGILSDTSYLTRGCTTADFDAMEFLFPSIDESLLDRIANPQVDPDALEARARAVLDREQRTPYVVSDVGAVGNLDAIPQAADELLQLEGVTAAAVLGEKDGTLYVSARSRDDRVHAGRALEDAIADVPEAGAGGHARMGGGQLPLEEMAELRPASGFLQTHGTLTRQELHDRLFDAMAGQT